MRSHRTTRVQKNLMKMVRWKNWVMMVGEKTELLDKLSKTINIYSWLFMIICGAHHFDRSESEEDDDDDVVIRNRKSIVIENDEDLVWGGGCSEHSYITYTILTCG